MSGFEPDADALTRALRADTCTQEDLDRMRERLVAKGVHSLAVVAASTTLATAQGAKALSPLHVAWKALSGAKLTVASAIVVSSLATVAAVHHSRSGRAAEPVAQRSLPRPESRVERVTDVLASPKSDVYAPSAERDVPAYPAKPLARRAPRTRPALTQPARDTLQAESALLMRAAESLHAGDPGRAALLLDEHERRYPNGLLRAEREIARTRLK